MQLSPMRLETEGTSGLPGCPVGCPSDGAPSRAATAASKAGSNARLVGNGPLEIKKAMSEYQLCIFPCITTDQLSCKEGVSLNELMLSH